MGSTSSYGLGSLPNELKGNILLYLPNMLDQYNLAKACTEFNEYFETNIFRNLDLSFEFRLDDDIILKIFNWVANPQHVTHLNLNGLYWIDPDVLKYATIKFVNLESLFIVDTRVDNEQKNMEVIYGRLKKLHTIAINKCSHQLVKSFSLVRNDDRRHCIKAFKEEYSLDGNIVHIILGPHPYNKFNSALNGINWINEMCNSKSYKEFRDHQRQHYAKNRIDIDYDALLEIRDKPEVRERYNVAKITELIIKHPKTFMPVTCFKNLQKLTLCDTYRHTSLEEVFKECKMLMSLKIVSEDPNFTLKYLQYAKSLEEISLIQNGRFDFYTFAVMGPHENIKLQRIYIKCGKFIIASYENFRKFMSEIPRLRFFHMECDSSNFPMRKIKGTMDNAKTHPSQHFGISKGSSDVRGIPLSFINMLPLCLGSVHTEWEEWEEWPLRGSALV